MGLLDRDYYRDDEGGPIGAWLRHGLITKILFTICAVAFIIQASTRDGVGLLGAGPFSNTLGLIGGRVLGGEAWRLLTYTLLHPTSELMPLLLNLPLLWVVGHEVEQRLGRRRFLALYMFAAAASGALMMAAGWAGIGGTSLDGTLIVGATAPITAMLAWLALQNPRHKLTFFYALTVPVWVLLLIAIVPDAYGLAWPRVAAADGRKLTLAGHVGAVLIAVVFHLLLRMRTGGGGRVRREPRVESDLRIFREDDSAEDEDERVPAAVSSTPDLDEHLEAQLDAVLAKVSAQGQQSLTPSEREILNRASEIYRRRRR